MAVLAKMLESLVSINQYQEFYDMYDTIFMYAHELSLELKGLRMNAIIHLQRVQTVMENKSRRPMID